jgi:hypothetical protein
VQKKFKPFFAHTRSKVLVLQSLESKCYSACEIQSGCQLQEECNLVVLALAMLLQDRGSSMSGILAILLLMCIIHGNMGLLKEKKARFS